MINRYVKCNEPIGQGSFGVVYKAWDYFTSKYVAIKHLMVWTPENFQMFRREVQELLDSQDNPQIVRIFDYNLSGSNPFYVMEYCEGGSYGDLVGNVSPEEALIVLKAMVRALRNLHSTGGYYGDFKPNNILRAYDGEKIIPKLSDFGLARSPRPGSAMTFCERGTSGYKAPEIIAKFAYSAKADIYSLGITIFELIHGKAEIPFLFFSRGSTKLTNLLRWMTSDNPQLRPNLNQIEYAIAEIENDSKSDGFLASLSKLSYGELTVGAGVLALVLTAAFSKNEY